MMLVFWILIILVLVCLVVWAIRRTGASKQQEKSAWEALNESCAKWGIGGEELEKKQKYLEIQKSLTS